MLMGDFVEERAFEQARGEDPSISVGGGVAPPGEVDSHADLGNQGTHVDGLSAGTEC